MDQLSLFISFFVLAVIGIATVGCNVLLPAEVYWHKVLPNAPMPRALSDILHLDRLEIDLNTEKYTVDANPVWGPPLSSQSKKARHSYNDTDINTSIFFLEEDLQPGAIKNMIFTRNVLRTNFAPLHVAKEVPFSSTKLPEILTHFSIKPDTAKAAAIKTTLDSCEIPEIEGEHKFCARSLESLVESSMLVLGTRNVQALSTVVSKEGTPKQPYKVTTSFELERLPGSDIVACHALVYPFAVYYCHSIKGTKAYKIALTGKDGTKVAAVAVCHTETATWDPEHIAFKVLKVKPGTVPICHNFPQDNLLWIPNK